MVRQFMTVYMLLVLVLASCTSNQPPSDSVTESQEEASDSQTEKAENNPDADFATNFTLPTLAGDELSLDELRGQHVLVNFWATWCVPCRKEMPYLQAISEKHSEQLVVLGVNLNEEAERIHPFVDDMALTFPILLDPTDELLQEHNVRGLPVSFVVGPEGEVVYRRIGEILPEEFDAWLADNL